MADYASKYDEFELEEDKGKRQDTFRVRRSTASRSRKNADRGKASAPGGIRQRRNKHWNW